MNISQLKTNLLALEIESEEKKSLSDNSETYVEVLCDSVGQALAIASKELHTPISQLNYDVLQKKKSSFLGMVKTPCRVLVNIIQENLKQDSHSNDVEFKQNKVDVEKFTKLAPKVEFNQDGKVLIRIYKTGVHLTVKSHTGRGIPADIHMVKNKIAKAGVQKYNKNLVENIVKKRSGKAVKIAQWIPQPNADSTLTVEISQDEMLAYVNLSAPQFGGRHLTMNEVLQTLKNFGVVFGYQNDSLKMMLEEEKYNQQIVAAKGRFPKDGADSIIDYKVKIDKKINYKQDDQGRIDFFSKGLIENVVQGQLLAKKIPYQKGIPGRSVTGKITPAKDGEEKILHQGKGTILSEDKQFLTAEKNGKVVYIGGRIYVEEIFTVANDVGLDSGNISFIGSIVIYGSVLDNMEIKAAGTIKIGGSVQKAQIEAENNIIIRGGIQGKDEARIESTAGSVFAKFMQNTTVNAEKDIIVSEAIMHSRVQAVNKVLCKGRRAQIIGGEILAGLEVRAKQLGAQASTPTNIVVGVNPKIFKQQRTIKVIEENTSEKLKKVKQNIKTIKEQKRLIGKELSEEKEETLVRMLDIREKLELQLQGIVKDKKQLNKYISQDKYVGAIHVERTLYPGVSIEISGAHFITKDEYTHVSLINERGYIKFIPYQKEKQ